MAAQAGFLREVGVRENAAGLAVQLVFMTGHAVGHRHREREFHCVRHVHVVHEVCRIGVFGSYGRRVQRGGCPVQRIVDHVLPVLVSAIPVVIVAGLAGRKVGNIVDVRCAKTVFQVRNAMALFAACDVGLRYIGVRICVLRITECQHRVGDVVIEMHVRGGRDFGPGAALVCEQRRISDVAIDHRVVGRIFRRIRAGTGSAVLT